LSYCVNCGVKLAPDLKACPLCDTPVVNPRQEPSQTYESPYPDTIEEAVSHIDRGYARQLSIVAVMIPMIIALLVDIVDGGGIWSPYVMGVLVMLWCFVAVPLLFKLKGPYVYIAVDVIALCGYLALIAAMTDGFSWYLSIVLPMLLLIGLITLGMLLAFRRLEAPRLYRFAVIVLLGAVFLIGAEIIIDLASHRAVALGWSIYAGIPILVVAIMLAGLEHNKALKEQIRKRLFI
jgi:hypothetical protein